jgi:hypothetical protein
MAIEDRLRARLVESGDCLEWTGTKSKCGAVVYGRIRIGDSLKLVHRVVWETTNGEIPHGMEIGRRCRNSLCCKLDHMFLFPRKSLEG